MSDKQPDSFEQRAQTVLQESADRLDGATRSRLTQARHAALEAIKERDRKPWFWLMPAAGVAAAAVLALVLVLNPARQQAEQTTAFEPVDEMDILTAEDSLEFYRDMEFYAWLDTVLEDEPAADSDV